MQDKQASQKRILVVDDSDASRKLVSNGLAKQGYQCVEADDGSTALEILEGQGLTTFDAVLMDNDMPGLTGPETARIIRRKSEIAIIGITGLTLPDEVEYFEECGADVILSKPVSPKVLTRMKNICDGDREQINSPTPKV